MFETGPAGGSFQWIGGASGDWAVAANWFDLDSGTVATAPPGAADAVLIDGGDGTTISGIGDAATLSLSGTVLIAGIITVSTLVDSDADPSDSLSLAPDASLVILGQTAGQSATAAGTASADTRAGFLTVESNASLVLPEARTSFEIWNDGVVTLDADSAIPTGQILGQGTVLVESGFERSLAYAGTMQIGPTVGTDQHIVFDGPNASLFLGNGANTADTPILIENFLEADAIGIAGSVQSMQVVSTANGDLLELEELVGGVHGSTVTRYIQFDRDYAADGLSFSMVFSGAGAFDSGYTAITVSETAACFCPGTLIATPDGERAVEMLRIGDPVMTADGVSRPVLWIGRRFYHRRFAAGRDDLQPVRLRAGALGAGLPRRDLLVSPRHAMLVQGLLVPAELLVNGRTVVRETAADDLLYLHVELERHALLLAEGAPTESFADDDSRAMFDNAAEFAALYPDRPAQPPCWCAPRVEQGSGLLSAQRFVDAIAGLLPQTISAALSGRIDAVDAGMVRGWAWSPERPEAPVLLEILVDGAVAAQVLADRFRADLASAGIGTGCHGFELPVPDDARAIIVRRAEDGLALVA